MSSFVSHFGICEIKPSDLTDSSYCLSNEPYRDISKLVIHQIQLDEVGLIQSVFEIAEYLTIRDVILLKQ